MEKRYQVFVSSSYSDLQEERQEIIQALLELDCIPAGMELFPAANDDQWTLIKGVIDNCDYYIVIIGNRYGSIGPDGLSYTRMEYEYAVSRNIPVIGFLHKNPGSVPANRSESTDEGKKKLVDFRELIQKKTVKYWDGSKDLGSAVSRSIVQLIKRHPAIGWIRADVAASALAAPEILRLRNKIDDLEKKLSQNETSAPEAARGLANGDDFFLTEVTVRIDDTIYSLKQELSWDEIFDAVGPHMMDDLYEILMSNKIAARAYDSAVNLLEDELRLAIEVDKPKMVDDNFQTIKIQLLSLGLIEKSQKPKREGVFWTLTPYGRLRVFQLRAVKTSSPPDLSSAASVGRESEAHPDAA